MTIPAIDETLTIIYAIFNSVIMLIATANLFIQVRMV